MKSTVKCIIQNDSGDAVVEAAILFPIMIMIFFALVLLSFYLPTRAELQHITQYTATAIATVRSDTWLLYDTDAMSYGWHTDKNDLDNVYIAAIKSILPGSDESDAERIAKKLDKGLAVDPLRENTPDDELVISLEIINCIVYKEIVVTAVKKIPMPVNFSFIGFPSDLTIEVSSAAVVQNGDEFIRNMDIAVDFVKYIDEKLGISSSDAFGNFSDIMGEVRGFLGI